jgi:hypothetical protein
MTSADGEFFTIPIKREDASSVTRFLGQVSCFRVGDVFLGGFLDGRNLDTDDVWLLKTP